MRGSIPAAQLHQLVEGASKVIAGRTTIPVLECVLLEARDGTLRVSATNLSQWITLNAPCEIEDGSAVVDPRRLMVCLSAMSGDAKITLGASGLSVSGKGARSILSTLSADTWPSAPVMDRDAEFSCEAADLNGALAAVAHAIASDASRRSLGGVHLFHRVGSLVAQASDSYRCLRTPIANVGNIDFPVGGIIVPPDFIKLCALAKEGEAKLAISERTVTFECGSISIQSKLIDGTFPDIDRIISKSPRLLLRADRKSISAAVTAAAKFAEEHSSARAIAINESDVAAFGSEGTSANFTFEGEAGDAPETLWLNSRQLSPCLSSFSGETVEFWREGTAPIEIRGAGLDVCLIVGIAPTVQQAKAALLEAA
jgi:DNA polymerase-3 subunit beta